MNRIGIFIDGGYLDHINKHGYSGMTDYKKLISYLIENEGELTFGCYYDCMPHQTQNPTDKEKDAYSKKRKLIHLISKIPGMTIKLGKIQMKNGIPIQKRVDVLLALDIAKASWKDEIDTAILIAGDSDFVPALDEATACGVESVLYYYSPSYNNDLINASTRTHEITRDMWTKIVRYQ